MFTGIIEDVGTIERSIAGPSGGRELAIRTALDAIAVGDSVCVSGVCLTATRIEGPRFMVDVGPETLLRTTLGNLAPGSRVNLERAATLVTRLGGHLVQGHVDGTGTLQSIVARENAYDLTIEAPAVLLPLIASQGAICIEGISLTVTGIEGSTFGVMIIPHTWRATNLVERKAGERVNLEADLIARYVQRLLQAGGGAPESRLTEAFLREHGF